MIHDDFKFLYSDTLKAHMALETKLEDLRARLNSQTTIIDQADADYAISKISELMDDSAKKIRALLTLSEQLLTIRWVMSDCSGPIRTQHVTTSPKMTDMPKIPSKKSSPEAYAKFMSELGVPDTLVDSEAVRPHWPGLCDYIECFAEKGEPLPESLKNVDSYPVFKCTRRKKKGVLEH